MSSSIPYDKLDDYIRNHFKCSYMSDSKWKRLINRLGDGFAISYKLINDEKRYTFSLDQADDQFFVEPILYKEIEWIEFPHEYEDYLNPDNKKAGKVTLKQDLSRINGIMKSIGTYECEYTDHKIRIYGYR